MEKNVLDAIEEFKSGVNEIQTGMKEQSKEVKQVAGEVKKLTADLNAQLETCRKDVADLQTELRGLLRERALLLAHAISRREPGQISEQGARALGAHFIRHLESRGQLGSVFPHESHRNRLVAEAKDMEQIAQRWTGQTTTEFPLPSVYSGQIEILAAEYGVLRRSMTPFPLGGGTSKPPRSGTGMTFASIAMSAVFTEKNPTFGFASLESHKVGGIVITPRELEEQSIVAIGNYLAMIAAREFARVEDYWGLLADGSATYELVHGVCEIANDNTKVRNLAAGKTSPSDVGIADLRACFGLVNSAVRQSAGARWYLNNSWETYLPEFNTQANQYNFRYDGAGRAILLGKPVEWTEVMAAYSEDASASAWVTVLGDLRWWWFGKRPNSPRIDTSTELLFAYDQLATRFIEEIDFDYMATDAAAAVRTASA